MGPPCLSILDSLCACALWKLSNTFYFLRFPDDCCWGVSYSHKDHKSSLVTSLALAKEKAVASHSSTLAWKIPWVEEPGRLQSMGSLGVGHDWATSPSLSCIGEGNGNPLQCSCLENPRDGGAWWAAVYGVTQSQTWLKWLSSSSKEMSVGAPTSSMGPGEGHPLPPTRHF